MSEVEKSDSPEAVRDRWITALHLVQREMFHKHGFYPSELMTVAKALEDAQRGIKNPNLMPSNKPQWRPQDPGSVWEARAMLVLAIETLMALGKPLKVAARQVGRDVRFKVLDSSPKRRLDKAILGWRDQLNHGRAPRDGEHREVLKEGGLISRSTGVWRRSYARSTTVPSGTPTCCSTDIMFPVLPPTFTGSRRRYPA